VSDTTAVLTPAPRRFARAVRRLAAVRSDELAGAVARREALRFATGRRAHQGLIVALAAAAAMALLIPLHRAFGVGGEELHGHYFLLYTVAVQFALFILSARAVWLSHRQDITTGSLDELLLAGVSAPQALMGRWLGLCLAAVFWVAMLAPFALFAGAFTGISTTVIALVFATWLLTCWTGGLVGTLMTMTERGVAPVIGPGMLFFQFWFMSNLMLPRMLSGIPPPWPDLIRNLRQLDPVSMAPTALGYVHEPWVAKALFLLLLLAFGALWISGWEGEWSTARARQTQTGGELLTLRPFRQWVGGRPEDRSPDYGPHPERQFERAFGWRMRVSPPAWVAVLGLGLLPALPAAILGRDGYLAAAILALCDACAAAFLGAMGMAASLAGEREQERWTFLRCTPLTLTNILAAKWLAVWLEAWPLWVLSLVRALGLALAGTLTWSAVPIAALAPPVAGAAAAGVAAGLCARAATLTAGQQRALLLLLAPPLLVLVARALLPGLPNLEYLSLPHVVLQGVAPNRDSGEVLQSMGVLAAYLGLGLVGMATAWIQLAREEA
jgi:hypothetical protein